MTAYRDWLAGKRVTVIGLAATGLATANSLAAAGCRVTISETRQAEKLEVDPGLLDRRVTLELGGHKPQTVIESDLVVPSPGVPRDAHPLRLAVERAIPVLSEIELAYRLIPRPMLAVTGTNGKGTTVSLLGAMLVESGLRAPVVGNIGDPLINYAFHEEEYDRLVVEISSFQLEWVDEFRPAAAAVLNVTDDHLDRYRDFDDYLLTKMRITARQEAGDVLVLNHDDAGLRTWAPAARARVIFFSHGSARHGVFHVDGRIWTDLEGRGRPEELLAVSDLKLVGQHNVENVMAAAALALVQGVPRAAVLRAAQAFEALAHRNELVAEINGVRWYDDSKGTNVGAVRKSLQGFAAPVILIAGGREKGGSYAPLADEVRRNVKLLVLIGEARERMRRELGALTATVEAASMDEAVERAAEAAVAGDAVLLSPACSSFDMFHDYHHRGMAFREAIGRLPCRAR